MPLVSFHELMHEADQSQYAVGYFESWNLESLLAVADAAEATRSPVILGFSGIYLFSPDRQVRDPLGAYAAMGLEVCRSAAVPTCLLFNESPYVDKVLSAVDLGFNMVMFADETLGEAEQTERVRQVVGRAQGAGATVEAETAAPPGVDGELGKLPDELHLTDPERARAFVDATGVDSLAVNVGQAHLHGREEVRLRLDLVEALRDTVPVPLALHGASSIAPADLQTAIALGVRKINVGSVLKQSYFAALAEGCAQVGPEANPYEIIGSGYPQDVLARGRLAMQQTVEQWMGLLGSAGKA